VCRMSIVATKKPSTSEPRTSDQVTSILFYLYRQKRRKIYVRENGFWGLTSLPIKVKPGSSLKIGGLD
jgi:hypothetical protein